MVFSYQMLVFIVLCSYISCIDDITQHALQHIFTHDDYIGCKAKLANVTGYQAPCEISTVDDKAALIDAMNCSHCSTSILSLTCQDQHGMICIPSNVRFDCLCKNHKKDPYEGASYSWGHWWTQVTSQPAALRREMCHTSTGQCISSESFIGVGYLVVHHDMQSSIFTASTTNGLTNIKRARVDLDLSTGQCAWLPLLGDSSTSWIEYDLQKPYVVLGLYMVRCDVNTMTTSLNLHHSNDKITWVTTLDVILLDYDIYLNATHWLDEPIENRYWKMFPLTWTTGIPRIKADLIGYLND